MTPILSICIASHSDTAELIQTIYSIVNTTPDGAFEIVVVDDASMPPVTFAQKDTVVIRNPVRIGCGPSRFVGAMHAKGAWLLFTDSHMRFVPGWFEEFLKHAQTGPASRVYCGSCLGLDAKNMDVAKARPYFAAEWTMYGPDRKAGMPQQVFECVWAKEQPNDVYEISAVMGACYFVSRAWFMHLRPFQHLRSWAGDEQELSLKTHLAGGDIYFLKNVRIGHKFKSGGLNKIKPSEPVLNKLFLIWTLLPREYAMRLQRKMPRGGAMTLALRELQDHWHLVETERAYNQTIFSNTLDSFLQKFGISFPKD